jgi:hypothetical protein
MLRFPHCGQRGSVTSYFALQNLQYFLPCEAAIAFGFDAFIITLQDIFVKHLRIICIIPSNFVDGFV